MTRCVWSYRIAVYWLSESFHSFAAQRSFLKFTLKRCDGLDFSCKRAVRNKVKNDYIRRSSLFEAEP